MKKITRSRFIAATGREPEQDDLERCNCVQAGEIGHICCGWNEVADKPWFEATPAEIQSRRPKSVAFSKAEILASLR